MPSIVGKRRGGQTYYYLVESARVDGKPRIVSQQYLGSAEEVVAKLSETGVGEPVRSQHRQFGDLAAVWSVLERLGVVAVIDEVAPRHANAALSVGTYMALATANRIVDPCSKRAFADWWATTAGPRWVKAPAAALDHRRFWDAMDRLDEAALGRIEADLGRAMVTEFGLDLSGLVLGHDQLRHLHRLDQRPERRSRSAARPSRNAATCGWSGWRWWSPGTAGSRWSPTPTRATGPTSPSSPP